jgi:hypothetical protein
VVTGQQRNCYCCTVVQVGFSFTDSAILMPSSANTFTQTVKSKQFEEPPKCQPISSHQQHLSCTKGSDDFETVSTYDGFCYFVIILMTL